jgi:hypothetical protein
MWLSASDRPAVTRSASRIDELLRVDPQQQGDLRFDSARSIIVGALGVEFEVVFLYLTMRRKLTKQRSVFNRSPALLAASAPPLRMRPPGG